MECVEYIVFKGFNVFNFQERKMTITFPTTRYLLMRIIRDLLLMLGNILIM